ncbi:MAG: hypothetical protein ABIH89_00150 [Elusimicrobiota bacterium]
MIKTSTWKASTRYLDGGDYEKYSKVQINMAMQSFKRRGTEDDYFVIIDGIIEDIIENKYILETAEEGIRDILQKFI